MKRLLFGTAGVPLSTKHRSSVEGVARVRELGLDCMELEFVHGVNMSAEIATLVQKEAQKHDVVLTAHAPYFINLTSDDAKIQKSSVDRILQTARVAHQCGGYSFTFHAAFYGKQDHEVVYEGVRSYLREIVKALSDEGIKIWVRPELTGKASQFGDLLELIRLSQDVPGVLPCIDFSHYHARYNGKMNNAKEFSAALLAIEHGLGREALDNMHVHISGIEYGEKGERNHLDLEKSDLKYKELMKSFKEFGVKGVVICESPSIEGDALLLQRTYKDM